MNHENKKTKEKKLLERKAHLNNERIVSPSISTDCAHTYTQIHTFTHMYRYRLLIESDLLEMRRIWATYKYIFKGGLTIRTINEKSVRVRVCVRACNCITLASVLAIIASLFFAYSDINIVHMYLSIYLSINGIIKRWVNQMNVVATGQMYTNVLPRMKKRLSGYFTLFPLSIRCSISSSLSSHISQTNQYNHHHHDQFQLDTFAIFKFEI